MSSWPQATRDDPEADLMPPDMEMGPPITTTVPPDAEIFIPKTNGVIKRTSAEMVAGSPQVDGISPADPEVGDDGDSATGLWVHLRGVAHIWRFSGALPLEGLGSNCSHGLRFRWRCWSTVYTLILRVLGTLVEAYIYFELVRLRQAMGLSRLDLYFHVLRSGLILLLVLVLNAVLLIRIRRFPPLMRHWARTDRTLCSLEGKRGARVRRLSWLVGGIMFVTTTIINGLLTFRVTQIAFGPPVSWGVRAYAVFFTTLVSGFFYMRVLYIDIEFTFIFARALQAGFRKVRENLKERFQRPTSANGEPFEPLVETSRLEYMSVCSLVAEVDQLCSASALTTVCILFACVYANVYNCIVEVRSGRLDFALLTNFLFAAAAMLGLMVMFFEGSRIRTEARKIILFLQKAKFSHLCIRDQMQLQFWVSSCTQSLPCLTAWGLFPLTREAAITIIGVVATYVTILVQVQSPKVSV